MATTKDRATETPPPEPAAQGSDERQLGLETELRQSVLHKIRRGLQLWWSGEISLRRLLNAGLCYLSLRRRWTRVLGKPFFVMIEPTNACNLRCPLCPTGCGTLDRPKAFLPLEQFQQCIDELGPYALEVNLTNYGEPMLHPDLPAMVAYAKAAGLKVRLGTNGHFLTQDSARALVEAGLDAVYISYDGVDQDSYATYRVRGDLAKVRDGVRVLREQRQALQSSAPFVELQFLVMRHNEDQIEAFRSVADELGADRRIIKPVSFNVADWDDADTRSTFQDFFPEQEQYQVYVHEDGDWRWRRDGLDFCTAPWRTLTVLADGAIVPCCRDPRGKYTMGNVAAGVLAVWNNDRYRAFRRSLIERREKMPICNVCPGE
ncbi:MAG: radical SAM/SPASM domain-containing protein [Planctomycetota bacterium]